MAYTIRYGKTKMMATITQNIPGSRCTIDRRIYRDEIGNEYVRVNGCWLNLDSYMNDHHYEVYRWYNP